MATDLTVTIALPPRGRGTAVLRVAAQFDPSLLRIVAGVPMPDFRQPFALHRFVLRRDRALARLDDAVVLARTIVGPQTQIETDLVRGRLSDYLASGQNRGRVLVVGRTSARGEPVERTVMRDGRVVVAVAEEREPESLGVRS